MTYTLETFCQDARKAIAADPGPASRERIRICLERLLTNEKFVSDALGPDAPTGRRALYADPEYGFVVLAHVNAKSHRSPPHDHGSSWAVYGQAMEYTDMTVWKRLDHGSGAGEAKLTPVREYRLTPGHAGLYDVGDIHSIAFPDNARFVRVTGRDLDHVQRLRFDLEQGKAITIESVSASG